MLPVDANTSSSAQATGMLPVDANTSSSVQGQQVCCLLKVLQSHRDCCRNLRSVDGHERNCTFVLRQLSCIL